MQSLQWYHEVNNVKSVFKLNVEPIKMIARGQKMATSVQDFCEIESGIMGVRIM